MTCIAFRPCRLSSRRRSRHVITVAAPSNQQLASAHSARCLQTSPLSIPTALWTRPYLLSFHRRGFRASVATKHKASSVQRGSESMCVCFPSLGALSCSYWGHVGSKACDWDRPSVGKGTQHIPSKAPRRMGECCNREGHGRPQIHRQPSKVLWPGTEPFRLLLPEPEP